MKAHAHTLTGCAAWMAAECGWQALGHPVTWTAAVGGAVVAGGVALAPDMDAQATAARSLGWVTRIPAYGVMAMTKHRGMTHWALTGAAVAATVQLFAYIPFVPAIVLFLGAVWCKAGFDADDKRYRRSGIVLLAFYGLLGTAIIYDVDPRMRWLGLAVLCGWWAHILGDFCTTDRWPVLAPLTQREFGGWRLIPPCPPGQRVTMQERIAETLLFTACCAATVQVFNAWTVLADAGRAAQHAGTVALTYARAQGWVA